MESLIATKKQTITSDQITLDIRKSVIGDFLCGMDIEDVASKNKIAPHQVSRIIETSPRTQSSLARTQFATSAIRENARIMELKMAYYDYLDDTIATFSQKDNKEVSLPIMSEIISELDKTSRLNIDKPTENKQETTRHIDIAETLKALKTDDDKLRFLVENQPLNIA
jgi:hypothetical protein